MDFSVLKNLLLGLLPVLLGTLSPLITAGVKKGVDAIGVKIPNSLKPVVNGVIGAIVGGLSGDTTAGLIGAGLGKSVRDQLDKK